MPYLDPEKSKLQKRRYYRLHREKILAYSRRRWRTYYQQNRRSILKKTAAYGHAHPEARRAYCKKWYRANRRWYYRVNARKRKVQWALRRKKRHQEFRAKEIAYEKSHPEQKRLWSRRYREHHRRQVRRTQREWSKNNPGRRAEHSRRRRAHLAKVKREPLSARDIKKILGSFGKKCAYCQIKKLLTVDHVVPIDKGGAHAKGNLVPACSWCNSSKMNRDWRSWFRAQSFYSSRREKRIVRFLKRTKDAAL